MSVLSAQIEFIGEQADAFDREAHRNAMFCRQIEDLVALFIAASRQLFKHAAEEKAKLNWNDADVQQILPVWKMAAVAGEKVLAIVQLITSIGYSVDGAAEFMHAFNEIKMVSESSNQILEASRSVSAGEQRGRPFGEILTELRNRNRTVGR